MKRRALLLASGAALVFPSRLFAQASKPPRRIAILLPGTPSSYRDRVDAFRAELKKLGYEEGRDVVLEMRWAENKMPRLASLATEVVALKPAVIVTGTSAGVAAVKNATSTIPIVFGSAGSPVEQGFVASLRRPGGNITGVLVPAMEAKLAEIARELLPRARRIAMLVHKSDPFGKIAVDAFVPAVKRLNFEPLVVEVARGEELALAFNEIVRQKPDALIAPSLVFMNVHRDYLVERSLEARLPLLSSFEEMTAAGALLSYGNERNESYRRVAVLVDKILRGASPAELPVDQPEKLQLIINLKTARTIGVSMSRDFLQRADRVIN